MITQEQAVASTSILTIVTGYFLWTLIETEGFLPYVTEGTPQIGNILLFVFLISFLLGGALTILFAIIVIILSGVRKKEVVKLSGVNIFITHFSVFFFISLALLLHVFNIFSPIFILLSYAGISGIVIYGKIKEKNRFKKYTSKSNRKGSAEKPLQV